jgi:hypothetical protein
LEKYVTKGTVTGILSFAAVIAGVFGKAGLAAFLNAPETAASILTIAGGFGGLIAGLLQGIKQTPAA